MRAFRLCLVLFLTALAIAGFAKAEDAANADPVDVTGRAVDEQGKPVAGATVFLASANRLQSKEPRLSSTTTATDGSFAFHQVKLPLDEGQRDAEARFEVYGAADGYGYSWQGMRIYRPIAPPDERVPEEQGRVYYQGDPIVTVLVFGAPATLRGQITDDTGKPLAGARVELGVVQDERTGNNSWLCTLLESSSRSVHIDDRSFASVRLMPTAFLSAETDGEGNYIIKGLPREARLLGRISFQPGYEQKRFSLATTTTPQPRVECLGYDGVLNHSFQVPRPVRVQVLRADTGSPAENVRVRVRGKRLVTDGNQATSDRDGRLELRLTPGEYVLIADPAWQEPYVKTEQPIVVSEEMREQSVALPLARGATIVLTAIDVEGGRPVAGVDFMVGPDTSAERHVLQSQTVFVDNPATDATGQLQAILPAGSYQFVVGTVPAGYESVRKTSDPCVLVAGETKDARFELRRVSSAPLAAEPTVTSATSSENPYPPELVEKWNRQRDLLTRGRAKLSVIRSGFPWLDKDKLEAILRGADPEKIPDLAAALEREYPDQTIRFATVEIESDGHRHREVSSYAGKIYSVLATNGKESIQFHPDGAQADVYGREKLHIGMRSLRELCYWSSVTTPRAKADAKDAPRATVESIDDRLKLTLRPAASQPADWTSTVLADPQTGFINSTISDHGTTGSQRWQFAPKKYDNGAIVPGMYVEFTYRDGKVDLLKVHRIESLEFDAEFPPDAFVVSAPAGTNVLDYRDGSSGNPKQRVAYEPVFDVVSFANSISDDTRSRAEVVKLGDPAPAVDPEVWLSQTGSAAAPDMAGKVVLVEFWGIGCGPCIGQLPEVQAAARRNADKGLVVIGLHGSGENVEAVAEFAQKRGLTYPLAIDRGGPRGFFGKTFAAYGVRGIPHTAIIDRQGRIAYLGHLEAAISKAEELLQSSVN